MLILNILLMEILECLEAWEEMIQQFEVGEKISPVTS